MNFVVLVCWSKVHKWSFFPIVISKTMLGGLCASRGVRGKIFGHFKVKCINLVLSERSKLRASTHELLVEQRKNVNLYQDNKEGSNIFLVMRVSVCITLSMVF